MTYSNTQMRKTALIQIRVTQGEHDRLTIVALRRGIKLSEMIRSNLEQIKK